MSVFRLFVGFDSDQPLASQVFAYSVLRRASMPVSIHPLVLKQLEGFFSRPRDPMQSTEFAFSRFLVPYLCDFEGWAVFADGDMLCQGDVAELWALRDTRFAVQVVKRDQSGMTERGLKFLGRPQMPYQKKNWSSVMLFNNVACRNLSPEYVAVASGLELHQFKWLQSEALIGDLPKAWNHLVGVDPEQSGAKIVHYTLGMPYFHGWRECEYAPEWRHECSAMTMHQGGPEEER